MDEYWAEFADESEELITDLNNGLLELERNPDDRDVVDDIFRTAHTLKGNCGSVGLEDATELAHAIEDLLDSVRADQLSVDAAVMDVTFDAIDVLETVIEEASFDGESSTDATGAIEAIREHLQTPSFRTPERTEVKTLLDRLNPDASTVQDTYLVRLAVERDETVNNGHLVVVALEDAFDVIGTEPPLSEIERNEHENVLDVVFAAAVDESAIAAALEPVDAVSSFDILDVTDLVEESIESTEDDPFELLESSDVSSEEAQEMSVDDLLDEFDDLDDIDTLAAEVGDASEFEAMGKAGTFDELLDSAGSDDSDTTTADEPSDSTVRTTAAQETGSEPAPTTNEEATGDDEPVDDAQAVFEELQQEVEPVEFDELAAEIETLEFEEFDDEEEVGFEELLGEDVDMDDPTFLESPTDRGGAEGSTDESVDSPSVHEEEAVTGESLESSDVSPSAIDHESVEPVGDEFQQANESEDETATAADGTPNAGVEPTATVDAESSTADPLDDDSPADDLLDDGSPADDLLDDGSPADDLLDDGSPADDPLDDGSPADDPLDDGSPADDPLDDGSPADDSLETADSTDDIESGLDDHESTVEEDPESSPGKVVDVIQEDGAEPTTETESVDEGVAMSPTMAKSDSEPGSEPVAASEGSEDEWLCEWCGRGFTAPQGLGSHKRFCPNRPDETDSTDDGLSAGSKAEETAPPGAEDVSAAVSDSIPDSETFEYIDASESDFDVEDEGVDAASFEVPDGDVEFDVSVDDSSETFDVEEPELESLSGGFEADQPPAFDEDAESALEVDIDSVSSDTETPEESATESFETTLEYDESDAGFDEPTATFDPLGTGSTATGTSETDDETGSTDVDGLDLELPIPDIEIPEDEQRLDSGGSDYGGSIRVDVEQVDTLLTLVEGLVTTRVRLRDAVESKEDPDAIDRELATLEEFTTDLQETVMDVRLVPIETVANRLPRVVRDIAREQGKTVEFVLDGGDVELDRGVLERIGDPLTHLVRNAVDHGIESPTHRVEVDKPETGSVELRATRERDRVNIVVADDGRGMDPDGLREEAIEAGIVEPDTAESMTDDEIYDLTFHPGLSTADAVTDVSGRGVGMDVVERTVRALDGTVSIESEPGEGTTVTMTIPVSVAIDDVLFLHSGSEQFGVPTKTVQDIERAASIETDGDVVSFEDEDVPVVTLGDALDTDTSTSASEGMLVRIRNDVRSVAIHCDEVRNQREVVVKPFDDFLGGIPGISGATVAGRGDVVTILDVTTL